MLTQPIEIVLTDEADMFGPRSNVARYQRKRSEVTRNGDRIEREFPKGMLMSELIKNYAATVRAIDDAMGRRIEALRESQQFDQTWIVFTSDDGIPFGEDGFVNKTGPFDPCQRVPLLIRGPAGSVVAGGVCQHPVGAIDVIPTLWSIADEHHTDARTPDRGVRKDG